MFTSKKQTSLFIICCIILSVAGFVFAIKVMYEPVPKDKVVQKSEDAGENASIPSTQEQREKDEKTEKMLGESWQDLRESFDIREKDYIRLNFKEFNDFLAGKQSVIHDNSFIQPVAKDIIDTLWKAPEGSTEPNILIKKDYVEILIAYKDKDDNNVLHKFKKGLKGWEKHTDFKAGKAVTKIE
ncbi:MAG: hypothetical protein N2645_04815 [Clostridia bacterium]|nr:hypothetical protein [Clostridia bacterium]